jgi:DNA-binding NarL/FixJ family response regulator
MPKRSKSLSKTPPTPPSEISRKHFHGKRVVIIDDHPLIRRGLERMIHSGDGFTVCGEAGNAVEAMKVVTATKPDLAIVDVGLPGEDGIELTRRLLRKFPTMAILILSMHEEPEYAARALAAGARGYMVKHEAVEKIGSALTQVLSGERYLSPIIATGLTPLWARLKKSGARRNKLVLPNSS